MPELQTKLIITKDEVGDKTIIIHSYQYHNDITRYFYEAPSDAEELYYALRTLLGKF